MTMMTRAVELGPPHTRTGPLPGELLTVADVTDGPVYWNDGTGAFESANCPSISSLYDGCSHSGGKLFNTPVWGNAVPSAAYGGLVCATVGFDQGAWGARLSQSFHAMETVALEKTLHDKILSVSGGPIIGGSYIFDVSSTKNELLAAVGELESYAASHYAGTPVIVMPRSLVTMLSGTHALYRDGDKISTLQGSWVVGGNFGGPMKGPDGSTPAAGNTYIYVLGEVLVRRGPAVEHSIVDTTKNTVTQLTEGMYLLGVDCMIAAVQLTGGPAIPVDASGATAGAPGTWTPAGSIVPANVNSMGGVTASPATAWTIGQYVQTRTSGVPGQCYWNGSSWVQGKAP